MRLPLLFLIPLLQAGVFLGSPTLAQEAGGFGLESQLESAAEASEEAEEIDEIETDRDSFTPASSLVGARRLVIESAYSFIDNRDVKETHSFPEALARYGLTENIELRLGWNYEVGGAGSPVSGNVSDAFAAEPELERESRIFYGAKLGLSEQAGWRPQTAVMVHGFTPTAGEQHDTTVASSYIAGWELPNRWNWTSAMRYSTGSQEEDRFNIWSPSTALKVPLGERWKGHVEYFGVFSDGREEETTQHFFSPGAHYLITPDLEVGFRVGWGLNEQAPNFFSNIGFGIRY